MSVELPGSMYGILSKSTLKSVLSTVKVRALLNRHAALSGAAIESVSLC
jgi:hypothetical protein